MLQDATFLGYISADFARTRKDWRDRGRHKFRVVRPTPSAWISGADGLILSRYMNPFTTSGAPLTPCFMKIS